MTATVSFCQSAIRRSKQTNAHMAEATSSYTPTANVILLSVNRIRCASGSVCEAAFFVWTTGLPQLRQASALSPGASLKAIVVDGQRSSLSVLLLCKSVFIFISGVSALSGAHVVVYLTCHINMPICFTRKRTKHKNLEARHFRMIQKWPPTVKR